MSPLGTGVPEKIDRGLGQSGFNFPVNVLLVEVENIQKMYRQTFFSNSVFFANSHGAKCTIRCTLNSPLHVAMIL